MDLRQRVARAMDKISTNRAEVARRLNIKPQAVYRGDVVTIDPDADLRPGSMVVVIVDGGAVVREFRPRHDHIELSPLNPRHREYRIPNLTPEILIGVVIETTRRRD